MDNEARDDAMEDGIVIVALHAELNEVARGLGRLFAPQFNLNVTCGRVQDHLGTAIE